MFSSFSIQHTRLDIRKEARQQLSTILLISFLPLIIGFVVIAFSTNVTSIQLVWHGFQTVFLHGELYFYAISSCAYITFLSSLNLHRGNRGMVLWSNVFVVFCGAFMAAYIAQGETRNLMIHGWTSVFFLVVAVIINYRVIVLSQQPPLVPDEVNRESVRAMTEELDVDYDS